MTREDILQRHIDSMEIKYSELVTACRSLLAGRFDEYYVCVDEDDLLCIEELIGEPND